MDFNVLIHYRRQGIGTALMGAAEEAAGQRSPVVGLGVCPHLDYAAAQVLYVKRGYVPDGRGLYYRGRYPEYGDLVEIGDDLTLYLTRRLWESQIHHKDKKFHPILRGLRGHDFSRWRRESD